MTFRTPAGLTRPALDAVLRAAGRHPPPAAGRRRPATGRSPCPPAGTPVPVTEGPARRRRRGGAPRPGTAASCCRPSGRRPDPGAAAGHPPPGHRRRLLADHRRRPRPRLADVGAGRPSRSTRSPPLPQLVAARRRARRATFTDETGHWRDVLATPDPPLGSRARGPGRRHRRHRADSSPSRCRPRSAPPLLSTGRPPPCTAASTTSCSPAFAARRRPLARRRTAPVAGEPGGPRPGATSTATSTCPARSAGSPPSTRSGSTPAPRGRRPRRGPACRRGPRGQGAAAGRARQGPRLRRPAPPAGEADLAARRRRSCSTTSAGSPPATAGDWAPTGAAARGRRPGEPARCRLEINAYAATGRRRRVHGDAVLARRASRPRPTWPRSAERWMRRAGAPSAAAPTSAGHTPSDFPLVRARPRRDVDDLADGAADILPLLPLQEGMYFHAAVAEPAPTRTCVQQVAELTGPVDPGGCARAVEAAVRRHAALRAGFRELRDGRIVQAIAAVGPGAVAEYGHRRRRPATASRGRGARRAVRPGPAARAALRAGLARRHRPPARRDDAPHPRRRLVRTRSCSATSSRLRARRRTCPRRR